VLVLLLVIVLVLVIGAVVISSRRRRDRDHGRSADLTIGHPLPRDLGRYLRMGHNCLFE
jgi:hypothetical protein